MKYIKIKNKGTIEHQALTLLGASTKRGDSTKIGQFGSGNKYALAYFLRADYSIAIYSGKSEIVLTTKKEVFREEEFDILYVNDEKTSITTQMGKDWEYWQAMRELYCNALDEGECTINMVQEIEPIENETHFYIRVENKAIEFMTNFDNYFATNKEVLFECEQGRILKKTGEVANVYRRSIRCYRTERVSIFDYDLKNIAIDENRLVKYSWTVEEKLWDLIYRCTNKEVIMEILHKVSDINLIESGISEHSTITASNISEEFKECLNTVNLAPSGYAGLLKPDEVHNHIIIPTKVFKSIRHTIADDNVGDSFKVTLNGELYRPIEMNNLQEASLDKALEFFKEVGFVVPYDIVIGIFDNKDILGLADKEKIILSDLTLTLGVNEICNTIIEEYIHIKYKVSDRTREFQTAAISEFIDYMKKTNAYVI